MWNRVNPKKSLGQNFLRDTNITRKIINSLELDSKDVVLEIGPGEGALTNYLVEKAERIIAVEVDKRCIELLTEKFGSKIKIIDKDILKVSIEEIYKEEKIKIRVVGNIPYYITSAILFHIFDSSKYVKNFTAMMQKEVAKRLVAKPKTKDYGILSVMAQYFSSPKILFDVSRSCFYPMPNVTSSVVRLELEKSNVIRAIDENIFRTIVRGTFNTRRKTLRNGLKILMHLQKQLKLQVIIWKCVQRN